MPVERRRRYGERNRIFGLVGSVLLHLLVAAILIFGVPEPNAPSETDFALPVDLVSAGEPTASPPTSERAAVPEIAPDNTAKPEPQQRAEAPPPPKDETQKPEIGIKIDPLAEIVPPKKPPPPVYGAGDQVKLAHAQPHPVPYPMSTENASAGTPSDETEIGSDANARGPAAYNVKDLIRTEIERRWDFDVAAQGTADLSVSIHLVIDPDGTIDKVEILNDPAHANDARYHQLAISARNAVLVSSPLHLPPGALRDIGDMVLVFSPKDVLR
jgi:outer membrane biosynthesis protein TonB